MATVTKSPKATRSSRRSRTSKTKPVAFEPGKERGTKKEPVEKVHLWYRSGSKGDDVLAPHSVYTTLDDAQHDPFDPEHASKEKSHPLTVTFLGSQFFVVEMEAPRRFVPRHCLDVPDFSDWPFYYSASGEWYGTPTVFQFREDALAMAVGLNLRNRAEIERPGEDWAYILEAGTIDRVSGFYSADVKKGYGVMHASESIVFRVVIPTVEEVAHFCGSKFKAKGGAA